MIVGDTIVAIASGPGRSARGLVRLSGPACPAIASTLRIPCERAATIATIPLAGAELRCPCLVYPAPRSYTGEDAIELLPPGNPALLDLIIATLLTTPDVRLAGPGEFTARAYLNSRMTIDQAEGVAMIIAARDRAELDAARKTLSGETGERYRSMADAIADALALVEAGVDFADQEDVVPITARELIERLNAIESQINDITGAAPTAPPSHAPRIALVGPPNAGKSTLFNALLGRERAVVSPVAGTTRDAIIETLDLSDAAPGAGIVELVDLAGLDEALAAPLDDAAHRAALAEIERADALIQCDPRGQFDLPILRREVPILRVRTKGDLPAMSNTADLAVCALDGWNLGPLKRAITDIVAGLHGAAALVAPRHAHAIRQTAQSLASARRRAEDALDADHLVDAELIAHDLRDALDAIGAITGKVTPDDVIGRIFAGFCIGK